MSKTWTGVAPTMSATATGSRSSCRVTMYVPSSSARAVGAVGAVWATGSGAAAVAADMGKAMAAASRATATGRARLRRLRMG
ncbi:hypothetical protein WKI68_25025 [Streptomyces sp. MS1.HAVA.3]|uniref:Uncharacterized protein n=1 Tax=Streptomyces caledonius TaxID=3134107 RepID=A0ABU8U785_9ACTN